MTAKPLRRGIYRSGNEVNGIILDSTHHPIIFNHWYGELTEAGVDAYWKMRDETCYDGIAKKIILVHLFEIKPPPATVRKRGAELAQNDPYIQDGTFVSVMVLKNPLLRGVMTAVLWMAGKENFPMEFTSSLEDGIILAKRLLEQEGIIPAAVASYTFPKDNIRPWP